MRLKIYSYMNKDGGRYYIAYIENRPYFVRKLELAVTRGSARPARRGVWLYKGDIRIEDDRVYLLDV